MKRTVSGPGAVPFEPLKSREQQILELLGEKYTDQEIADQLFLSVSTVKWYVRKIYQKLGVKNRRQAVNVASSLGILDSRSLPTKATQQLPTPTSPFIGRHAELEGLVRMILKPSCRLLTVLVDCQPYFDM